MGLDLVELIMAAEEEFDIFYDDKRLWGCETVGKLTEYTYELLQDGHGESCRSLTTFNAVRKILVEDFNIDRNRVHSESEIKDLLTAGKVIQFYEKLDEIQHRKLIEKYLPGKFKLIIVVLCVFMISSFVSLELGAALLTSFVLFIFCLTIYLIKRKKRVTCEFHTIADICNFSSSNWHSKKVTKEEIFEKIKEITIEQLGVPSEQVTWDARFVNDLGCD